MPKKVQKHDKRLKTLIRHCPDLALQLFQDEYLSTGVDLSNIEWHDKEFFLPSSKGESRELDLLARVRTLQPVDPSPEAPLKWKKSYLDFEVESRSSTTSLKKRLHDYYHAVRHATKLTVLHLVIYTKVKLNAVGWDTIQHYYGRRCIFHLDYQYVSLAAMNGLVHVRSSNTPAVSLVGLMQIPEDQKAETKALALQTIAVSGHNDTVKGLMFEAVEAYLELTPKQQIPFENIMRSQERKEAAVVAKTSYEKGMKEGKKEGRKAGRQKGRTEGRKEGLAEGQRNLLERALLKRGITLTEAHRQRLATMDPDTYPQLLDDILDGKSLRALGLEG